MSVLDRAKDGLTSARGRRAPGAESSPPPFDRRAELLRRRDRLAHEFAELQYDLGGLAYEMAIRDHVRLDVLLRSAARLQEVDAELGELERILRLKEAGATGSCPSCGALHAHGSSYCWQCGNQLLEPIEPSLVSPSPRTPGAP